MGDFIESLPMPGKIRRVALDDDRQLRIEALRLATGLMREYYRDGQSVPGIGGKQVDVDEKTLHVAEQFHRWLKDG